MAWPATLARIFCAESGSGKSCSAGILRFFNQRYKPLTRTTIVTVRGDLGTAYEASSHEHYQGDGEVGQVGHGATSCGRYCIS